MSGAKCDFSKVLNQGLVDKTIKKTKEKEILSSKVRKRQRNGSNTWKGNDPILC
jgi:hypothetical protein